MNGPEHYREAEKLIDEAERRWGSERDGDPMPYAVFVLHQAQVHATLALAAATVAPTGRFDGGDGRSESYPLSPDWQGAIQ